MKWLQERFLNLLHLVLSRFGLAPGPGSAKQERSKEPPRTASSGDVDFDQLTIAVDKATRQNAGATDGVDRPSKVTPSIELQDKPKSDAETAEATSAVLREAEVAAAAVGTKLDHANSVSSEAAAIEQTPLVPDAEPLAESLDGAEKPANSETAAVVKQTQAPSDTELVGHQAEQTNVVIPEDLRDADDAHRVPQSTSSLANTTEVLNSDVGAEWTQNPKVASTVVGHIGAVDESLSVPHAELPDEIVAEPVAPTAISTETEGVPRVADTESEQVDTVSSDAPVVELTPVIPHARPAATLQSQPEPQTAETDEGTPDVKAEGTADTILEPTIPSLSNTAVVEKPELDHESGPIVTSQDETVRVASSESGPATEQLVSDSVLPDKPGIEAVALSEVSTDSKADATELETELNPTDSPEPAPRAFEEPATTESEPVSEQQKDAVTSKPASESPTIPRHTAARRSPSSRRPSPSEAAEEFQAAVNDISTIDREYSRWNSAIVEYLLLAKPASEDIYFCVTPRILATAFAESGFDSLTPDEAEQRFSAAVANVYRRRVLGHRERLRVLRRCGADGSPDCAAFLGASVLAAYHMQSDEDVSGNAYYRRFADLLLCEMCGNHPAGFSAPVFESLWVYLGNWLREAHGRRLATPSSVVGLRRFVALPLAHVPLRSLDIDKLPAFFARAAYEPGKRVQSERLRCDLRQWHRSRNALTHTGAEALFDNRSEAVLSQVNAELESWDGSFSESVNRRSALIEIQFDVVQRQPVLGYLPRRPSGFPAVFDDGDHVFEASDDGWYAPARISPVDGELLACGFEWQSVIEGTQFALKHSETSVIALSQSANYSGFLSTRRLPRGIRSSVLCHDNVTTNVVQYLSEAAQQRLIAVNHPLLPNGWSMVRDVTAKVHLDAPAGLENLEIDPNIEVLVSGGLRLGRGWSWLAGAPPRILVAGVDVGDAVTVNGTSAEIGDNGELLTNGAFAQPGQYVIEAGRARRRIEIVAPQVSMHRRTDPPIRTSCSKPVRVALPRGDWTLIGASPDEVVIASGAASAYGSMVVSVPFEPAWAIQVGAGPGAKALAIAEPQPPNEFDVRTLPMRNAWQKWAGVIYSASIRRPQLCTLTGSRTAGIEQIWRQYASVAKQIKRSAKRT